MTGTLSFARQMCHALCAITASDSGCPCNYKYFRSCFSTSLSHTHPSLPPLCQPGNPGIQVTTSAPPASAPAFLLFLYFLWMSQLWWTAPTFVFLLPFFFISPVTLPCLPFSWFPLLLWLHWRQLPKLMMPLLCFEENTACRQGSATAYCCMSVRHFNEGSNLQI